MASAPLGVGRRGIPPCSTCGRMHLGECWRKTGACMVCGSKEHQVKECPKVTQNPLVATIEASNQKGNKQSSSVAGTEWRGATTSAASKGEGNGPAQSYALRGMLLEVLRRSKHLMR